MANGCEIILNPGTYAIYWQPGKNLIIQSPNSSDPPPASYHLVMSGKFFQDMKLTTDESHLILTAV